MKRGHLQCTGANTAALEGHHLHSTCAPGHARQHRQHPPARPHLYTMASPAASISALISGLASLTCCSSSSGGEGDGSEGPSACGRLAKQQQGRQQQQEALPPLPRHACAARHARHRRQSSCCGGGASGAPHHPAARPPGRCTHLLACVLSHNQHAIGEALQVHQLLGLCKLLGVVLGSHTGGAGRAGWRGWWCAAMPVGGRAGGVAVPPVYLALNLHVEADLLSGSCAKAGDVDDGDDLVQGGGWQGGEG